MKDEGDKAAAELLKVLDLEQVEQNLYLGTNEARMHGRLFGGQVLAQAAMAASRTVENVQLHSLHGYFMRAGTTERPVLYEIERIRDGRSFVTRRVVAIQNGEAIFSMDVSFQIEEMGFDHALPMPNVPMPDELTDDVELARQRTEIDAGKLSPIAKVVRPFESRSVFQIDGEGWDDDRHWSPTWVKFRGEVDTQDVRLGRCLLAYVSDMSLVSTASLPHQSRIGRGSLQIASLDHALWIHRPVPIDEWLLFHKRTSNARGSRGLVHADFFSANGVLLASVTQEGLLRLPRDDK